MHYTTRSARVLVHTLGLPLKKKFPPHACNGILETIPSTRSPILKQSRRCHDKPSMTSKAWFILCDFGPKRWSYTHCETGSKTAVVMVLRPNIACDKYLTVSEIQDDYLAMWRLTNRNAAAPDAALHDVLWSHVVAYDWEGVVSVQSAHIEPGVVFKCVRFVSRGVVCNELKRLLKSHSIKQAGAKRLRRPIRSQKKSPVQGGVVCGLKMKLFLEIMQEYKVNKMPPGTSGPRCGWRVDVHFSGYL